MTRYDFMGPHEIITRHTRPRTRGRRTAPLTHGLLAGMKLVLRGYEAAFSLGCKTGLAGPVLAAKSASLPLP